jgi:hypothetical protein
MEWHKYIKGLGRGEKGEWGGLEKNKMDKIITGC